MKSDPSSGVGGIVQGGAAPRHVRAMRNGGRNGLMAQEAELRREHFAGGNSIKELAGATGLSQTRSVGHCAAIIRRVTAERRSLACSSRLGRTSIGCSKMARTSPGLESASRVSRWAVPQDGSRWLSARGPCVLHARLRGRFSGRSSGPARFRKLRCRGTEARDAGRACSDLAGPGGDRVFWATRARGRVGVQQAH